MRFLAISVVAIVLLLAYAGCGEDKAEPADAGMDVVVTPDLEVDVGADVAVEDDATVEDDAAVVEDDGSISDVAVEDAAPDAPAGD